MGILLAALAAPAAPAAGESKSQPAVRVAQATKAPLLHAVRAGGRLVAVGDYGVVILSDDGGRSWRQAQAVAERTTLTDVWFADEKRGWAVGHGGAVLRTTDGGENWSLQYRAPIKDPLLSVWFENPERGFAVGAFGFAMETRDGGASWKEIKVAEGDDRDRHLNQVFPGPEGSLFIAAESGTAFRSDDKGRTWHTLKLPYKGSLWGGVTLADGSVLVYGMRGNVFRTRDKGKSWQPVASGTDRSLTGGVQLPDGRVVLVGLGGAVAFGAPNASQLTSLVREDRQNLASVAQGGGTDVMVFGQLGVSRQALRTGK
ncbi:MAG: glycosyl hydrolase [Betaproteobacteria bacterium]|nr:glycosyl hydrolase [Betaproteobacteria bacterium]